MSILVITMLGVTMFSGLQASCMDLRRSADAFFDAQSLHDLEVVSTLGLTDEDIEVLSALPDVLTARGQFVKTLSAAFDDNVMDIELEVLPEVLDLPYVTQGRMPQAAYEVAVTPRFLRDTGAEIGDTFHVTEETDEDEDPAFLQNTFTITGVVTDVRDVNNPFGSTAFRGGMNIKPKAFCLPEAVSTEVYTSVVLSLTDTAGEFCFGTVYKERVRSFREYLEADIKAQREAARHDALVAKAQEKIEEEEEKVSKELADALQELTDGEKELQESLAEAETELTDAEREISKGEREIQKAGDELAEGTKELLTEKAKADREIANAKQEIADNEATLVKAESDLASAAEEIASGEKQLQEGKNELAAKETAANAQIASARAEANAGKAQAQAALDELAKNATAIEAARAGVSAMQGQMSGLQGQLAGVQAALSEKQSQIAAIEAVPEEDRSAEQIQSLATLTAEAAALQGQADSLTDGINTLQGQIDTYQGQIDAYDAGVQQATEGLAAAEAGLAQIAQQETQAASQFASARAEIASKEKELSDAKTAYENGVAEAADGRQKLEDAKKELADKEAEAAQEFEKAAGEIKDAVKEADAAGGDLESARAEVQSGWADYEEGKEKGLEELQEGYDSYYEGKQEAEEEIAKAWAKLDEIDLATWYLRDRDALSAYNNISSDADAIDAIGTVFPIVFFVVAILISLTGVTRMVEEDRGLVGTYKALGYENAQILRKYLVFSVAAALAGSVLGTGMAFYGLPAFLFTIFDIMYILPSYSPSFLLPHVFLGPAVFTAGVVIAAAVACRNELKETPASLMRPRAPKNGSRVLIERIGVLWHRLSFLNKVTARNIFRYKKRMCMTIFGIAGCMALLLFGFAIKDSVRDLMPRQYEETNRYDLLIVGATEEEPDASTPDTLPYYLTHDEEIDSYLDAYITTVKIENEARQELSTQMIVVEDGASLVSYITLRDEKGREHTLSDGEVLLTNNASIMLSVQEGDTIRVQEMDLTTAQLAVSLIVRNYLGNAVYLTQNTYEQFFGTFEQNGAMVILKENVADASGYRENFAAREGILSCLNTGEMVEQFSQTFLLMDMVVYIVIAMSAALAFAVLFTLATTNISERERELATIKVLGFYDREVHLYVDKETLILTGIGILIGVPLGYLFAQTLTVILKIPSMYLAASLHTVSYFYAAGLSVTFALLVNLITDRILDRVDPVTALKSVE